MSKETMTAMDCPGCGRRIQFMANHLPHCAGAAVKNNRVPTKSVPAITSRVAEKMNVPVVVDKKIRKRAGKVRP